MSTGGAKNGPAAEDEARMFSKEGRGDDGSRNEDDPDRNMTVDEGDSASVKSDDRVESVAGMHGNA